MGAGTVGDGVVSVCRRRVGVTASGGSLKNEWFLGKSNSSANCGGQLFNELGSSCSATNLLFFRVSFENGKNPWMG